MRVCLIVFGGILAAGWLPAGSVEGPMTRYTSVVRTDARSGRLVRSVVAAKRNKSSTQPAPAKAKSSQAAPLPVTDLGRIIDETARTHNIDPLLVHSMIKAESNYNPFAVSPKGALGLMQLMPSTARQLGVSNAFDARENVDGGVRYFKYLRTLYKNDDRLALAAYNAGPAAVAKYGSVPPFPETLEYVRKVGTSYGVAKPAAEEAKVSPAEEPAGEPLEPQYSKLEAMIDSQGRIFLRTR